MYWPEDVIYISLNCSTFLQFSIPFRVPCTNYPNCASSNWYFQRIQLWIVGGFNFFVWGGGMSETEGFTLNFSEPSKIIGEWYWYDICRCIVKASICFPIFLLVYFSFFLCSIINFDKWTYRSRAIQNIWFSASSPYMVFIRKSAGPKEC